MRKSFHTTVFLFIIFSIIFSSIPNSANAQVNIPDQNLKDAIKSELGITTDPTAADMLGLTSLTASNVGIVDLTGLDTATNLTSLDLSNNPISDITALAGLTNLTILNLSSNQISNIMSLSGLTNLLYLYLDHNQISDITDLSGLTNLRSLALTNNQISDVTSLSGLTTNLIWLFLTNNQISDITSLSGLTGLTSLHLGYNQIIDITSLSGLTNLMFLDLYDNQISNITALSGLLILTKLALHNNQISDITALSGLTNLIQLVLASNQISDITSLSGLTNLTSLFLISNQLSDITALSGLTNLISLLLHDNQISDISSLSTLTNLTELYLQANPLNGEAYNTYIPLIITNNPGIVLQYDPLQPIYIPDPNLATAIESALGISEPNAVDMLSLTSLSSLSSNIVDLTGLEYAINLTSLNLQNNQISDISALSGLTNLTTLWLPINQISDITALSGLTNLIQLILASNQISDITALSELINLADLYINDNQISDISPLSTLTNLIALDLFNNPLNAAAYCTYVSLIQSNNAGLTNFSVDPNPYNCSNLFISVVPESIPANSPNGVTFQTRAATNGGGIQLEIFNDENGDGSVNGNDWSVFRNVFVDNELNTGDDMITGDLEPSSPGMTILLDFNGGTFPAGNYIVRVEDATAQSATASFTLTPVASSITVSGNVYEQGTTTPVPYSLVYSFDVLTEQFISFVYTDINGAFTLPVPSSGDIGIAAGKDGFIGFDIDNNILTVPPTGVTGYDLFLIPSTATITGTVTEEGTGAPIWGARIGVNTNDNKNSGVGGAITDTNGNYSIAVLQGVEWHVGVNSLPSGYFAALIPANNYESNITIVPTVAGPNIVDFTVRPETASIEAEVMTEDGLSVEGALVTVSRLNETVPSLDNQENAEFTDINGLASVGIEAGEWRVQFCMGCHDHPVRVNGTVTELVPQAGVDLSSPITNGEQRAVPLIAYYADCVIEGTVYKSDGTTPVDDATVNAWSSNAVNGPTGNQTFLGNINSQARTEIDGTYRLPVVGGDWSVSVYRSDLNRQSANQQVTCVTDGDDIINQPGETISGIDHTLDLVQNLSIQKVWSFTETIAGNPNRPDGWYLHLKANIEDPNGVPGNIQSVVAENLDAGIDPNIHNLNYGSGNAFKIHPVNSDANPKHGVYRFTVTKNNGQTDEKHATSIDTPVQLDAIPNLVISDNSTSPTFSFDTIPNVDFYRFSIIEMRNSSLFIVYQSPNSDITSFQVPAGILTLGGNFYLRAEAYDRNTTDGDGKNDTENRSVHFMEVTYAGSIEGTVTYGGSQTGRTVVGISTEPWSCSAPNPDGQTGVETLPDGSYVITGLPDDTYYVASGMYTCGDNCDFKITDPWGIYGDCSVSAVQIINGNAVTSVDITLTDGTYQNPNPFYDPWQSETPMNTARNQFTCGVIDGKIYTFGGNDSTGANLKSTEVFDPISRTWSFLANNENNNGNGVEELSGAVLNGKLYVFGAWGGGTPYGVFNFVEEYDPVTNTWTSKAPKPTTTASATAVAYNGEIYLFGGYYEEDGNPASRVEYDIVEAYNPFTDSWRFVTNIPGNFGMPSIAVVGNRAYLMGGYDQLQDQIFGDVIAYDFPTNQWITTGFTPMPTPRIISHAGAAPVIDGQIYLIGGIEGNSINAWVSDIVEIYDTATDTWSTGPALPVAAGDQCHVELNNSIYSLGGITYLDQGGPDTRTDAVNRLELAPPDPRIVGQWGVSGLTHDNSGSWSSVAAKATFRSDGTASEDKQFNIDGVISQLSENFIYTATNNPDGSITLTEIFTDRTETHRIVISDDGSMFVKDETSDTSSQAIVFGVKMDETKTYSNADLSGDYFEIGYDHDTVGTEWPGNYVAYSAEPNFNDVAGSFTVSGNSNADSNVDVYTGGGSYDVNTAGLLNLNNGEFAGYVSGNGNTVVASSATASNSTSFESLFMMKKGDIDYSTVSPEGTFAMVGFMERGGTNFASLIGTITCDSNGDCLNVFKIRENDGTLSYFTDNNSISIAADGSVNASNMTGSPSFAVAIGNSGNTLISNVSFNTSEPNYPNQRMIQVGVRCDSCSNIAGLPDLDGDGYDSSEDCDDTDNTVYPGATELCDGQLNDCNGVGIPIDEIDDDSDGYVECAIDVGGWDGPIVKLGDDCDDADGGINPVAADVICDGVDDNCNGTPDDGYIATGTTCGIGACGSTGTTTCIGGTEGDTCTPGTPVSEVCDNQDNNCDGSIDENLTQGTTCGVGECAGNVGQETCTAGVWGGDTCNPLAGAAADDSVCNGLDDDCDGPVDEDYTISPTTCGVGECATTGLLECQGGIEVDTCTPLAAGVEGPFNDPTCSDTLDNDCDTLVDLAEDPGCLRQCVDNDGDGYGVSGNADCPNGTAVDCDDTDNTVFPSATELCDGQLNDCNGSMLLEEADDDLDGYVECTIDAGGWDGSAILGGDDCNDDVYGINPGAAELCDEVDNDCDGLTDPGLTTTYYQDSDSDTYGNFAVSQEACTQPVDYVLDNTDCDDTDGTVNPGEAEVCDGQDNNCDTTIPANETDDDGDNYVECTIDAGGWDGDAAIVGGDDCDDSDSSSYPGATEIPNDGIDQDCDGSDLVQQANLIITLLGSGTGTVTSSPAGIDCGVTCSASFISDTSVQLTTIPDADSYFAGWSGPDCSGTFSTFDVTMDTNKNCTATFNLTFPQISVSPPSHNYGYQVLGNTTIVQSFTVLNTGTGDMFMTSTPDITGPDALDFLEVNNECIQETVMPLAPGASAVDGPHFDLATGHYYMAVLVPGGITWDEANIAATNAGGYLAAITSAAENTFIYNLINSNPLYWNCCSSGNSAGPWIGGYKVGNVYEWITGEPFTYSNWGPSEPFGNGDRIGFFGYHSSMGPYWNDVPGSRAEFGYIVEYTSSSDISGVASCTIDVEFNPQTIGIKNATLNIHSTDAGSPELITLTGEGCNDSDGDGVCDSIDLCQGNDALGDGDSDGYCADTDCNDGDMGINPGATEICDGLDNDCDAGTVDGEGETAPANSSQFGVCIGSIQTCSGAGGWIDDYSGIANYEAVEVTCDTLNNDCDAQTDEGLTTTYYQDSDTDTYGNLAVPQEACSQPGGYVLDSTDCNDGNAAVNPAGVEGPFNDPTCSDTLDNDCDTLVDLAEDPGCLRQCVDNDGDGYGVSGNADCPNGTAVDCDDTDNTVFPSATELCDGQLNDCNGSMLPEEADDDGDAYVVCTIDAGGWDGSAIFGGGDCNDNNYGINPGASDTSCNDVDENCSGTADDGYVSTGTTCGTGACESTGATSCEAGAVVDSCTAGTPAADDSVCNGIDDDCDGSVDEDYVVDASCGVGVCQTNNTPSSCLGGAETACAPGLPTETPEATCDDTLDNDCDGAVDLLDVPDCSDVSYYCDVDGDTYISTLVSGTCNGAGCEPAGCQLTAGNDCNDGNNGINPGASDTSCNNVDENCSGTADDEYAATPTTCGVGECATTGTTTCIGGTEGDTCTPGTPVSEVCDNQDNNCDGSIDENLTQGTTCGVGECGSSGAETCVAGIWGGDTCIPGLPSETPEATCDDTLDNDCDGAVDLLDVPDCIDNLTMCMSISSAGATGERFSFSPAINEDGRFVVFESLATNLDPNCSNGMIHIYVHDRDTDEDNIFDEPGSVETVCISVNDNSVEGNEHSFSPSISGDGRFIAFESDATDIDVRLPAGSNGMSHIYIHDRDISGDGAFDETGDIATFIVSTDSTGTQGDNHSFSAAINFDGMYVTFESNATNLVTGDSNGLRDIFVHDINAVTTNLISINSDGTQGNSSSYSPAINSNGRFIVFESNSTNLVSGDAGAFRDIFVHDRDTDEDGVFDEIGAVSTTVVSIDSNGVFGDNSSFAASINSDGRYIAFESNATNLVAGDVNTQRDIFIHDRDVDGNGIFDEAGQIDTFIASVDSAGIQGNYYSFSAAISADGAYVAFVSLAENLVQDDINGRRDIFVNDIVTGETIRASVSNTDIEADNNNFAPAISSDGKYVAFESDSTNLIIDDNNGVRDIFVRYLVDSSLQDADGDGYYSNIDCDDNNPEVNPGAQEGPFNDPTCSDTLDNDCDGFIDDLDSDCDTIPFHPYDTDFDWIIGNFELLDVIDAWSTGILGNFELLDLIDFWATGCFQWDAVTGTYNAGC